MPNDILNKIKDKKLREMLETYRTTNIDFGLIDIMNYFYAKFRIDAIEAIFPKFEVDEEKSRIDLGGFMSHGQMFGVFLDVDEQTLTLHIETQYYVLIRRENKPNKGEKHGN